MSARTEAYGYQTRRYDRDGIVLLNRRRVTQYLGLRVYNLLEPGQNAYSSKRPNRPPALIYAQGMMRFFTDFGAFADDQSDNPELENDEFELLLGSIEGRNLWGYVDFSLGRQYDAELMDFFAYDGMRVRVNGPWAMFAEAYFGIQVDRSRPFAAAVFETDGTSGSSPDDDAVAPSFGVALGIEDPELFELRLAYRGVASHAEAFDDADQQQARSRWGTDQELFFAHLALPLPSWGSRVAGALRYNLLTSGFDELQLGLSQRLSERHQISVDLLRSRPHFDGDSIFNVFAIEPYSELAARYAAGLPWRLWLEVRGGYRWYWRDDAEADLDSGAYSTGVLFGWNHPRARADLELFASDGYGGMRFGADLGGLWRSPRWVFGRRITLDGRVSVVQIDEYRADLDSLTTLGLQAGAQIRLLPGLHLYLSVEDNINRLFDSAFRVLVVLDMAFAP